MKKVIYSISIILSVLIILAPCAAVIYAVYEHNMTSYIILGSTIVALIILYKPVQAFRYSAREGAEYDEFGRNKKKSNIMGLSRKEREALDLQKITDMERVIGSTELKKITKKGSADPEEDLNKLIGLSETKQKVKEMAARMKFEQEKKKEHKVNDEDSMSGRHMAFLGSPGTGKAQPLYSKVLTPSGFKTMKDVRPGDTVIDGDGNPTTVLGVYPQGVKPIYEVSFRDGTKTRCSDEHLWVVQNKKDRANKTYQTVSLKEIADRKDCWTVDFVKPVQMHNQELPIHPYLMGVILGNGQTSSGIVISIYDEEMLKYLPEFFPSGSYQLRLKSKFKPNKKDYSLMCTDTKRYTIGLRRFSYFGYHMYKLGLKGKKSHQKFIPDIYLNASENQRRWLLRGLLDTDGYVGNSIEYSTTSPYLRDGVMSLVRSLGGSANYITRQGKYTKNGEIHLGKENYRVFIQFSSEAESCFHLSRKRNAYNPKRTTDTFKKIITDITYVGEEECQCIYVDSPLHTYVTDDYIVTHNTTVARIMTGLLYKYKYIPQNKCIEIDGNFLKAGTQTATKTELVIRQAYGGVLFVDEAYALMEGDNYGKEAIATMIKRMEDNRNRFVLILAGYTEEMKKLIAFNPGFQSRIKDFLEFPDFTTEELKQIFTEMANSNGLVVSSEALDNFATRIEAEKKQNHFGNARTVRNILDESIDKHALNYSEHIIDSKDKYRLCKNDISPSIKQRSI